MVSSPIFSAAPSRLGLAVLLVAAGCNRAAPAAADPPAASQSAGPRTAGSDWPIFLGPNQDSRSPETGIITKWGETGLKLVWHKQLGTSYGAPTIAAGRLMQFDRFGDKSRLYCLDAQTGKELWRHEFPTEYEDLYQYNNGPRCSPVIDGDRVYAYARRWRAGLLPDERRQAALAEESQQGIRRRAEFLRRRQHAGRRRRPADRDGRRQPAESHKLAPGQLDRVEANGSGIVAFDKLTGEVKYKIADELASYASLKLATIDGRRWCFAFCRGGLLGFRAGQRQDRFPLSVARQASRKRQRQHAGRRRRRSAHQRDATAPAARCSKSRPANTKSSGRTTTASGPRAMQTHWMTPVYHDGYLYGCSGRHTENAVLRCIEWKTGKVMWDVPGMSRTSLLAIDGHFLCLGEFGQLWLLKLTPEKPEQIASIDYADPAIGQKLLGKAGPVLEYPCWAAPIVSHGLLYLRGKDRLICLEIIPQSK